MDAKKPMAPSANMMGAQVMDLLRLNGCGTE